MNNIFATGLLFLLASNAALADDCATLREAMAAAGEDFSPIKGAETDVIEGTVYFDSTLQLELLPECQVIESSDGVFWSCGNGVGSRRVHVDYGAVRSLVQRCGFRVRQTISNDDRGSMVDVISDDRQLVRISTSFSSRRNNAYLRVKRVR